MVIVSGLLAASHWLGVVGMDKLRLLLAKPSGKSTWIVKYRWIAASLDVPILNGNAILRAKATPRCEKLRKYPLLSARRTRAEYSLADLNVLPEASGTVGVCQDNQLITAGGNDMPSVSVAVVV